VLGRTAAELRAALNNAGSEPFVDGGGAALLEAVGQAANQLAAASGQASEGELRMADLAVTLDPAMPAMQRALALAQQGFAVFPLRPGMKRPMGEMKQWEQRASSDPARVRELFANAPRNANVAVAVGPSNVYGVDLDAWKEDRPTSGMETWRQISDGRQTPATLAVTTASGGWHLYYAMPDGANLRNTRGSESAGLGPSIDTRGHGGFLVAPGSVVDGHPYRIARFAPVAAMPDWLLGRLQSKPAAQQSTALFESQQQGVAAVQTGTPVAVKNPAAYRLAALTNNINNVLKSRSPDRNNTLFAAARNLGEISQALNLPISYVGPLLLAAAKTVGNDEEKIRGTIENGWKAGVGNPKVLAINASSSTEAGAEWNPRAHGGEQDQGGDHTAAWSDPGLPDLRVESGPTGAQLVNRTPRPQPSRPQQQAAQGPAQQQPPAGQRTAPQAAGPGAQQARPQQGGPVQGAQPPAPQAAAPGAQQPPQQQGAPAQGPAQQQTPAQGGPVQRGQGAQQQGGPGQGAQQPRPQQQAGPAQQRNQPQRAPQGAPGGWVWRPLAQQEAVNHAIHSVVSQLPSRPNREQRRAALYQISFNLGQFVAGGALPPQPTLGYLRQEIATRFLRLPWNTATDQAVVQGLMDARIAPLTQLGRWEPPAAPAARAVVNQAATAAQAPSSAAEQGTEQQNAATAPAPASEPAPNAQVAPSANQSAEQAAQQATTAPAQGTGTSDDEASSAPGEADPEAVADQLGEQFAAAAQAVVERHGPETEAALDAVVQAMADLLGPAPDPAVGAEREFGPLREALSSLVESLRPAEAAVRGTNAGNSPRWQGVRALGDRIARLWNNLGRHIGNGKDRLIAKMMRQVMRSGARAMAWGLNQLATQASPQDAEVLRQASATARSIAERLTNPASLQALQPRSALQPLAAAAAPSSSTEAEAAAEAPSSGTPQATAGAPQAAGAPAGDHDPETVYHDYIALSEDMRHTRHAVHSARDLPAVKAAQASADLRSLVRELDVAPYAVKPNEFAARPLAQQSEAYGRAARDLRTLVQHYRDQSAAAPVGLASLEELAGRFETLGTRYAATSAAMQQGGRGAPAQIGDAAARRASAGRQPSAPGSTGPKPATDRHRHPASTGRAASGATSSAASTPRPTR
jgi:hypothetical protein